MLRWAVAILTVGAMGTTGAMAKPNCVAALKDETGGAKRASIACSHDGSAKPQFACSFKWKLRNIKGGESVLSANFTVVKNDKNKEYFSEERVADDKIKEEVSSAVITCAE